MIELQPQDSDVAASCEAICRLILGPGCALPQRGYHLPRLHLNRDKIWSDRPDPARLDMFPRTTVPDLQAWLAPIAEIRPNWANALLMAPLHHPPLQLHALRLAERNTPPLLPPPYEAWLLELAEAGTVPGGQQRDGEWVMDFWLANGGFAFALDSLLASIELREPCLDHPSYFGGLAHLMPSYNPALVRLRQFLAGLDEAEYAAGKAIAGQRREHFAYGKNPGSTDLMLRVVIDFLFPDEPAWAEQDARAALAAKLTNGDSPLLDLVGCVRDPQLQAQLFRCNTCRFQSVAPAVMLVEAIRATGLAAAQGIGVLLDRKPEPYLIDILEQFATVDAARALLNHLEIRAAIAAIRRLQERMPEQIRDLVLHDQTVRDSPQRRALASEWAVETTINVAELVECPAILVGDVKPPAPLRLNLPPIADQPRYLGGPWQGEIHSPPSLINTVQENQRMRRPPIPERYQCQVLREIAEQVDSDQHPASRLEYFQLILADYPGLPRVDRTRPRDEQHHRAKQWAAEILASVPRCPTEEKLLLDIGLDPELLNDHVRLAEAIAGAERTPSAESLLALPPAIAALFLIHSRQSWNFDVECSEIPKLAAHLGLTGVPALLVLAKQQPTPTWQQLLLHDHPAIAPVAADLYLRQKQAKQLAEQWLFTFPLTAALALIPTALGKPGNARQAAEAALRLLVNHGQQSAVDTAAARHGAAAQEAITHWLAQPEAAPVKPISLPEFWQPERWRPVLLRNGKALPPPALERLAYLLAGSTAEIAHPGLRDVRAACTAESLAAFSWDLFSAWLLHGGVAKDNWALIALGWLGNDDTARQLAPLIRTWPGEAAHARAVLGLDVLATMGSDVALMYLNGIAEKIKFRALQERARDKINSLARRRNLSAEQLADRLAPSLGLDDDGQMTLDYGPRQFVVRCDGELKAEVQTDGKHLSDLPKPNRQDDPAMAEVAQSRFKEFKKDLRALAAQQLLRLEAAMTGRRRWPAAEFETLIARHPLLRHVAQRLIWGMYDEHGELLTSFRVAEDSSYADPTDHAWQLPHDSSVGIVHALDLPAAQRDAWSLVLGDYELVPPFPQLGRETYTLTAAERQTDALSRFTHGPKIATIKVFGLSSRGWQPGHPEVGGWISELCKPLAGGLLATLVLDPGTLIDDLTHEPLQQIGELKLERAVEYQPESFSALDEVTISELLRDIALLQS